MLFLVCTILFHYSFFQILQQLQIIGIGSLRLHLFALGVEDIIDLLGCFLSFIVGNTASTLQYVFFLELYPYQLPLVSNFLYIEHQNR